MAKRPTYTHPDYLPGRAALLALMSPEGREVCQKRFAGTEWPITAPVPAPAPVPVLVEASLPQSDLLTDITVIDLEFQPSAEGGQMLELAAVRYQNLQPVAQLLTFVRCRESINYHVNKLTGITEADVYNAPEERAVLQEFRRMAEGSLLVAHNIGADRRILEVTRTRLGATAPLANEWLCTMAWARTRYAAPHKLGELCERFGIPADGAHRALRDVQMCFALLCRMHAESPITEAAPPTKRRAGKAQAALSFAA